MSVSSKLLSNDIISRGLGDELFLSYIVSALKSERSRRLLSGVKLSKGPCLDISMVLPRIEKKGLTVNG